MRKRTGLLDYGPKFELSCSCCGARVLHRQKVARGYATIRLEAVPGIELPYGTRAYLDLCRDCLERLWPQQLASVELITPASETAQPVSTRPGA